MTAAHWPARRDLGEAPAPLRAWLTGELGAEPASWTTAVGGFSPGIAARVIAADGRRAFVKAVDSSANPDTPTLFRNEAAALRLLGSAPGAAEVLAPLLGVYDDGDWVALMLADVEGATPALPFIPDEVAVVGTGLERLAEFLTTVRIDAELPRLGSGGSLITGWRRVADGSADDPRLDPWIRAHLDLLLELAEHADTALRGDALLHFDIRSDNLLLTPDPRAAAGRRAVFVDWAWLRRGAVWCDAALFGYLATSPTAVPPELFVASSVLLREVPPRDLSSLVAVVTSSMTAGSLKPPSPGLPGIRDWQAGMAADGLSWLRERLDAGLV
jgi:hypothetical protein